MAKTSVFIRLEGIYFFAMSRHYLNPDNFSSNITHATFLSQISAEIKRNHRAPFVVNFQSNYENGNIPFYALVEILSFGTLSKFFKNLKNPDKKALALTYGLNYGYLESWIESISYVRNLCAHYGRLYNAKLTKAPKLYAIYRSQGISNYSIFAVLCCLKHLLPNDRHWAEFVDTIELLFEKYPAVRISTMGFPVNWKEILSGQTL